MRRRIGFGHGIRSAKVDAVHNRLPGTNRQLFLCPVVGSVVCRLGRTTVAALVAQLVEHGTFNAGVLGSNPNERIFVSAENVYKDPFSVARYSS